MALTSSPDGYAALVAEDCHLAAEFAQLCTVDDTTDALQVVADAAADIMAHCNRMPVITPTASNVSLLQAVRSIEEVAEECKLRGDEIQALWCRLLRHRLLGKEWPPVPGFRTGPA